MKVFVIEREPEIADYLEQLKTLVEVVQLDSTNPNISSYAELFKDGEKKILAVSPVVVDWKVSNEMLKNMLGLVAVASRSAWVNYLDLDYCKSNNIIVTNTAGANSQSVAEYAIWMMLSLARKLPLQTNNAFQQQLTSQMTQTEITDKTMGIIGLGNIGSKIAQIGTGLGMKVIYWSNTSRDDRFEYLPLEQVLSESDCLFNCVEVNDQTQGLLNKDRLRLLKSDACFISVLGGMGFGVEDNDYLIEMVHKGKLAGFAIENEHHPDYAIPTINSDANIFIPGAYAFYTKASLARTYQSWMDAIIGIVTGEYVNRVV